MVNQRTRLPEGMRIHPSSIHGSVSSTLGCKAPCSTKPKSPPSTAGFTLWSWSWESGWTWPILFDHWPMICLETDIGGHVKLAGVPMKWCYDLFVFGHERDLLWWETWLTGLDHAGSHPWQKKGRTGIIFQGEAWGLASSEEKMELAMIFAAPLSQCSQVLIKKACERFQSFERALPGENHEKSPGTK